MVLGIVEEPYVARGNPEDSDEPPFLSEWQDADEGRKLQEQVCLTLLQRSFREFLERTKRQYREDPNRKPQRARKRERKRKHQGKKKQNWFDAYKNWFRKEMAIDWD